MTTTIDLKQKFRDVLKQSYHEERNSYFYATSVIVSRFYTFLPLTSASDYILTFSIL